MLTQIRISREITLFEQFIISLQFHCTTYDRWLVIMIRMLEINDFLCIEQPINVPGFFPLYRYKFSTVCLD